jgi:hypothetical protein
VVRSATTIHRELTRLMEGISRLSCREMSTRQALQRHSFGHQDRPRERQTERKREREREKERERERERVEEGGHSPSPLCVFTFWRRPLTISKKNKYIQRGDKYFLR